MDKLGVVLDDEKAKTAGEGDSCPKCGGRVIERRDLNVKACEFCGTEPFEKRPKSK